MPTNSAMSFQLLDAIGCRFQNTILGQALSEYRMSALGQKQPLKTDWILPPEWLLSAYAEHSSPTRKHLNK
jgi:hypothetical protein